jgi:hypothetical protein
MGYYILSHYGRPATQPTPEQAKLWSDWRDQADSALIGGINLAGQAKTIHEGTIRDDVVAKRATGYSIIEAVSFAAATALAQNSPALQDGGRIELYEIFKVI